MEYDARLVSPRSVDSLARLERYSVSRLVKPVESVTGFLQLIEMASRTYADADGRPSAGYSGIRGVASLSLGDERITPISPFVAEGGFRSGFGISRISELCKTGDLQAD